MSEQMKELCAVHLVRAHNGIEPFRRFLESYRQNPGGIEHDLLIVFKGFDQQQDIIKYRELLAPFRHMTCDVSDEGFDITAYFTVVKSYTKQYRYFCFLNSFSEILDHDWLSKLHKIISRPGVGLVGATGSWQSHRGNYPLWSLPIFAIALFVINKRQHHERVGLKGIISEIAVVWQQSVFFLMNFDQFPNRHVRTNAFMISGKLMKTLEHLPMKTKMDTYSFESGKEGLTQLIHEMGSSILIVGKDGIGYEIDQWDKSRTYCQADQENLLVADNMTRDYQHGNAKRRKILSRWAWGK